MDKRNIKYLQPKKTILEQARSGLFKVTIFLVLIFTIFLFLIPGFLSLFFGDDIPMIDDSDLMLPKIELARAENAFYDLDKIKEVYEGEEGMIDIEKYIESDEWDIESVNQILEKNEKELRYFDNAADKDQFLLPSMANPEDGMYDVYPLNPFRTISRVAALRSLKSLRDGSDEQAYREALHVVKIGKMIEESQGHLITNLVGIAIKQNGLMAMGEVIRKTKVNIYRLGYYDDFLIELESEINVSGLKANYLVYKMNIAKIEEGEMEIDGFEGKRSYVLKNDFYFKPNKTVELYYDKFKKLVEYFEEPCYIAPTPEDYPLFQDGLWSIPSLYIKENLAGKMYATNPVMGLNNIKSKACIEQTRLSGVKLMNNIKRYYMRNGELPNLLDDLVPTFAEKIDNDPLSGIGFEYDKNKMTLISVGGDHEIDTEDDIIFDLNFGNKVNVPVEEGEVK